MMSAVYQGCLSGLFSQERFGGNDSSRSSVSAGSVRLCPHCTTSPSHCPARAIYLKQLLCTAPCSSGRCTVGCTELCQVLNSTSWLWSANGCCIAAHQWQPGLSRQNASKLVQKWSAIATLCAVCCAVFVCCLLSALPL